MDPASPASGYRHERGSQMGRHEERSPEPGTAADDQGRVSGRGSEDEHRGDFAEGQAATHAPADALQGDFARGLRDDAPTEAEHRGDFAEGQSETHTPPDARRGDFARGMGDEGSRGSG
jgi:hypothetical protein